MRVTGSTYYTFRILSRNSFENAELLVQMESRSSSLGLTKAFKMILNTKKSAEYLSSIYSPADM